MNLHRFELLTTVITQVPTFKHLRDIKLWKLSYLILHFFCCILWWSGTCLVKKGVGHCCPNDIPTFLGKDKLLWRTYVICQRYYRAWNLLAQVLLPYPKSKRGHNMSVTQLQKLVSKLSIIYWINGATLHSLWRYKVCIKKNGLMCHTNVIDCIKRILQGLIRPDNN